MAANLTRDLHCSPCLYILATVFTAELYSWPLSLVFTPPPPPATVLNVLHPSGCHEDTNTQRQQQQAVKPASGGVQLNSDSLDSGKIFLQILDCTALKYAYSFKTQGFFFNFFFFYTSI